MTIEVHKGRGAVSSQPGRFAERTVAMDDAYSMPERAPDTVVTAMQAKSIISRNQSPDIPFDQSINPYQGCEHGCVYCYARPSHSYLDLSPGLDFETRIFYKPNAVDLLIAEWRKPGYRCEPIAIGANTDPYQPAEKSLGITRRLLETFLEYRHPVSLITKGGLMARDLDLLEALAAENLVSVAVSIPTMDAALKRVLEPRVPAATVRLKLIRDLVGVGVPVSLLMAPIIPAVNDREIEDTVAAAADSGAGHASWILLRLPHELKSLFREWLATHLPDRADHVMNLLREASGGKDYDNRFGVRQRGRGPYATMLGDRFSAACRRYGIGDIRARTRLDTTRFRRPGDRQMALAFD